MNQWLDLEIDPSEQNTRSPVCLAPKTHINMLGLGNYTGRNIIWAPTIKSYYVGVNLYSCIGEIGIGKSNEIF